MPGDIARRSTSALTTSRGVGRQSRDLARALDTIETNSLVRIAQAQADAFAANTRVQTAAFVAHTGMNMTASLAATEARLAAQVPHALPQLEQIMESFAMVAAIEVARLGWKI